MLTIRSASFGTVILFIGLNLPQATAAWWYVDNAVSQSGDGGAWSTAFKTIQEAIDAASEGDTVTVAPGTYIENIHFRGKNITLTSVAPPNPDIVGTTIIDGNQAGSVVSFDGTEDEACTLSGFTIRNGRESAGGGISGGYWLERTHATIKNNVIAGNSAEYAGGGLANSDGTIVNNAITNNTAELGGGLVDCNGVISGNVITYNTVSSSGYYRRACGGGLARCQALVQGNTISHNRTAGGAGGGLYRCDHVIRNNTVTENSAGPEGGGLADCDGVIQDNTISNNSAQYGGGLFDCDGTIDKNTISSNGGGGLSECDGTVQNNMILGNGSSKYEGGALARCDGTIQNNVIAGNTPGLLSCHGTIRNNTVVGNRAWRPAGGLLACTGTITNCIVWGNESAAGAQIEYSSEPSYSCIEGWTEGGESNIAEDPRFTDPDGPDNNPETWEDNDYRLRTDSPCIDAGFNDPELPETDIAGMHRIMFGGKSLTVDMGAYEFYINELTRGPNPDQTTFTWSSLSDKTYSIFYSADLLTWRLAIATFPSSGNTTTSWIDDGSATGVLPSLVPRRFYRTLEDL